MKNTMNILMKNSTRTVAIVAAACSFASAVSFADDAEPYTRVTETKSGDVVLEMCQRTFVPTDGQGPKIHLVSAIHIADEPFYQEMQRVLETYDSVLFEGVKPAGLDAIGSELDDQAKADATGKRLELLLDVAAGFYESNGRLPKNVADMVEHSDPRVAAVVKSIENDGWGQPIVSTITKTTMMDEVTENTIAFTSLGADQAFGGEGLDADITRDITRESVSYLPINIRSVKPIGIQTQMANALHVAFQLDEMDMTGKGWVNADIDIDTLQDQLSEMGKDNAMILQLLEGNSFQAKLIGFVLKFIERSPTMSSMMKLAMMDMLALIETNDVMGQFDAMQDVILYGRNDIVIEYLRAELETNPDHDDIAIFYGAAHMPGLEDVIVNELGYEVEMDTWAQAMTVNVKDTGLSAGQVKMMRNMIKNSLENQF